VESACCSCFFCFFFLSLRTRSLAICQGLLPLQLGGRRSMPRWCMRGVSSIMNAAAEPRHVMSRHTRQMSANRAHRRRDEKLDCKPAEFLDESYIMHHGMQHLPPKTLNFSILESSVNQHLTSLPSQPSNRRGGTWGLDSVPQPESQPRAMGASVNTSRGCAAVLCQAQHSFPAPAPR